MHPSHEHHKPGKAEDREEECGDGGAQEDMEPRRDLNDSGCGTIARPFGDFGTTVAQWAPDAGCPYSKCA